ncbi:MAG: dehydrogenase subunit [Armatimonadetes bacterium]|jgi:NADH-quinone oxidoreductase subunit D|nr:dehydrogenase subunit [Armatimonadota bacterium]
MDTDTLMGQAPAGNPEGETLVLNMGPQHPSTHGVLRLVLELDGETVLKCVPHIGYLHTGMEKSMENEPYQQAITITDRMDYLSGMNNNLAYCLAVEKLLGITVPPRGNAIRVLVSELQRIASHLIWLGAHAMDIGAMSVFLYCFREREMVLNFFEEIAGSRMTPSYVRVGGLSMDLPASVEPRIAQFLAIFSDRLDEYWTLLDENPIWRERTVGVGIMSGPDCLSYGVTGPRLRAAGVNYDIRKDHPYCGYEQYDFQVHLGEHGDVFDAYRVRMGEMREALKIIEQVLLTLPDGPYNADDPKIVLPAKERVFSDMEALIHHFILVTRGFPVPAGEVYASIESPKGELGYHIVSDGSEKPHRVRVRPPSFYNLSALPFVCEGRMVADVVANIGSLDIVLGEIDR